MAKSKRAAYGLALRRATYGLWAGRLSYNGFIDTLISDLLTYLAEAYYEGAAKMGIRKDELTDAEVTELTGRIFNQFQYTYTLAQFVQSNSKENGKLLRVAQSRIPMWLTTYDRFVNFGMLAAKEDPKLKWVLGATEHCDSCKKLAGKVKRKSQWMAADIYPKHGNLACGGWRCGCNWEPTDEPLSKGPLPKIP